MQIDGVAFIAVKENGNTKKASNGSRTQLGLAPCGLVNGDQNESQFGLRERH